MEKNIMNTLPLMPKATAVWLCDNTALTFKQIGDFCGLHELEVKAIADGDIATGMVGYDPVLSGQLTEANIKECEADPSKPLTLVLSEDYASVVKRQTRYTPVSRRSDKPDAIAWIIKHYPEMSVNAICKLIGTTKATVDAIKSRSHKKMAGIKPANPITLGLCTEDALNKAVALTNMRKGA